MSESEISVVYAREHFAEYLGRVTFSKDRVVVTKHGKKVAAVVPYEDLQLLEKLEEAIDLKDARAALADVKKHGTIPWEKVKSKFIEAVVEGLSDIEKGNTITPAMAKKKLGLKPRPGKKNQAVSL
jgi:prevent-host-death family protein